VGDSIDLSQVKMMIDAIDVDGGGEIDFEEFKTLASLQQVFDTFDNDGSGKIDSVEMQQMMESMGIVASEEQVLNMIQLVDTDGNNEVDFPEFCKIVKDNAGAAKGAKGFSFGGVVQRMRSGGPPFLWRDDDVAQKKGVGMKAEKRVLTHEGDNWGVYLMNEWVSSGRWGSSTVLMEFVELNCECYVGVVGKNYQARDQWAEPLAKEPHASAVYSVDGKASIKGRGSMQQTVPFGAKDRLSLEIDMQGQSCVVKLHEPDKDGGWKDKGCEVVLQGIHHEVAVAIALGPEADGKQSIIRIVGSSCEQQVKAGAAELQLSEEDQRGVVMDDVTKEALKLQT
jgi:hypothetical protein